MKSFLQNSDIEMYSTNNEGKSVSSERLIRTLKNKIYKNRTSDWKNLYINKLDDIVVRYSNTHPTIIKMKPVDVNSNKCFNSAK